MKTPNTKKHNPKYCAECGCRLTATTRTHSKQGNHRWVHRRCANAQARTAQAA